MSRKKLLMDVDCGVDDAQAIMLVLAAPNVDLLAVTCVHGNVPVDNVCLNTLRALQACNRLDVGATFFMLSGEHSEWNPSWNPVFWGFFVM